MRSLSFGLERLGLVVLRYPVITAIILGAITIAAVVGYTKLTVDDSLSELFRTDTQEFRDYEVMSERFPSSEYDVLIGVNLLREGLDLPEVALVAILDADKEGFLRSETSLVQTIGRAARGWRPFS